MKIAAVQFCPEFGNVEKNKLKIENYCNSIDADIIVFPELAFTGYDFQDKNEVRKFAVDFNSDFIQNFQKLSTQVDKIFVIGFAESDDEKLYNSAAILCPNANYSDVYRKVHLFYKERFCFDQTDKGYFVIDYKEKNLKLGTLICYDWRFPEATRTVALKGADVVVCPANLVTKVWHISTPSRALENKVYFAVANRIGSENRNGVDLEFNGASAIYSYNGTALQVASKDGEEVIIAQINPEETRKKSFNEINDIFADRRPELYL